MVTIVPKIVQQTDIKKKKNVSRKSGDEFEYHFALCAENLGIKCSTPKRFEQFSSVHSQCVSKCRKQCIESALAYISKGTKLTSFVLVKDNAGKVGKTADILFQTQTGTHPISVSLKRNNIYTKNHRPSNLPGHLGLLDFASYREDYARLNLKWSTHLLKKYKVYMEIPKELKKQMLFEFAELYHKHLKKAFEDVDLLKRYLSFIYGDSRFIVILTTKGSERITVIDMSKFDQMLKNVECTTKLTMNVMNPHILIQMGALLIDMRLATTSKHIKKSLDLKFHAEPKGLMEAFETIQITSESLHH